MFADVVTSGKLFRVELLCETEYRIIDKIGMPHVLNFITLKLVDYDTERLDWIKLLPLNRQVLLHGACVFPYRQDPQSDAWDHGYRIRASVNIEQIPPFTYSHWGRVPSAHNPRGWVSGEQEYRFGDLDECAVHTLAHECFHFLADSDQVTERDTEANANWWADVWLAEYQRNRTM